MNEEMALERKRTTYAISEHDGLRKEWNTRIPVLDMRMSTAEARSHELMRDLASIGERIPENVEVLMSTLKWVREKVSAIEVDHEKRFIIAEKDIFTLKKKQNLAEMEHRLCQRIDDVIKVLKATCADKNDMTKKWRILEGRLESTLEIIVMQLVEEPELLRGFVLSVVKGSKKLKNANFLLTHLKS